MSFHLQTKRLLLRTFEPRDALPFADYRSDPVVARYQSWDTPYSVIQAEQFVAEMQATKLAVPGEWYQVAIELCENGELIGDCVFCLSRDDPSQARVGFTLARTYQGQGYGFEAVHCLLAYLFDTLGLHRVNADCDTRNHASARLLERLGMRREAHFVDSLWFKGEWTSEYWYAILRSEWDNKKSVTVT